MWGISVKVSCKESTWGGCCAGAWIVLIHFAILEIRTEWLCPKDG